MEFNKFVLLLSAVSSAAALNMRVPAAEVQAQNLPDISNYTMVDMEWRGFEGFDDDVVFKGTIQDVIQQMKQIKGNDFVPGFVLRAEAAAQDKALVVRDQEPTSNQRMDCYVWMLKDVTVEAINNGIHYLASIEDSAICSNGPGPHNCGRISCSYDAAISNCNERTEIGAPMQCNVFAKYATNIVNQCSSPDHRTVAGQNFDDGYGISTIVGRQVC